MLKLTEQCSMINRNTKNSQGGNHQKYTISEKGTSILFL